MTGIEVNIGDKAYTNDWKDWVKHLRKRKSPLPLAKLFPGKTHPLTWALPDGFIVGDSMLAAATDGASPVRVDETMLREWLGDEDAKDCGVDFALEALACCHALPRLAEEFLPEAWWEFLQRLMAIAIDASALTPVEHGPASQLLGGELALTLAYLFPEITACSQLSQQARAVLSVGPVDLLDGEGMPHAADVFCLRMLLASWTRCRAMGKYMKKGCFCADAEAQYQWLIRQALRLARADGSVVFATLASEKAGSRKAMELAARRNWDLLGAAAAAGDGEDRGIFKAITSEQGKKNGRLKLPEAAYHSEWAAVSVLRPDWSAEGPRLAAAFAGREAVGVELSSGNTVLFSGPWSWQISIDGKVLEPISDWEEICWASDEDGDYLELELDLDKDVVLQRHLFLAREDGFLFLADSILCDEYADAETAAGKKKPRIEYRATLPLSPGITFAPAAESREGILTAGKKGLARVFSPALPEWRECESSGLLEAIDGCLELKFSAQAASALFAPLFFDLDRGRMARPITWRQLTVAESLVKQSDDAAVGYRVKLGDEQWLIYRSLALKANRTLLGHNLSTEMLIARFDAAGEVEALVEVE